MTSHWPHLPALSRLLAPYVVAGASAVSRCHDALGCDRSQESRGGTGEPREVVPQVSYCAPPASPTAHRDRTPTHPRPLPARSSQASKLAMMPFRHVRARRCAAATHHAPRACLFLTASPVLCRRREQPSAEPERIGTGGALDAGASLLRVLAATEGTPGRRSFAKHREGQPGAQNASASAQCQCCWLVECFNTLAANVCVFA